MASTASMSGRSGDAAQATFNGQISGQLLCERVLRCALLAANNAPAADAFGNNGQYG